MKLALAGDTMLGRGVAERMTANPSHVLVAPEVVAATQEADAFVLNLECCLSDRGQPWPDPYKPFFFRGLPAAAAALAGIGVTCVSLANNHALDFGGEALLDTLQHLEAAGIRWVGAGPDLTAARAPAVLEVGGATLGVIAFSDHPTAYAAGTSRPGIALAELEAELVPDWLLASISTLDADAVLVFPHWGPNMTARPVPEVVRAASQLVTAGATLVAGHSAHVFHGVGGRVLYDLGDFVDDYATHPVLRNDLGLLFLVELDASGPIRLEALPLEVGFSHTRLAAGESADWVRRRFCAACAALGTDVTVAEERLVIEWSGSNRGESRISP